MSITVQRTGRRTRAWNRVRRVTTHPALLVLLVAPWFGEALSGSTPPLDLLLPWNLAFMAALYGCGALVCREVAHRCGLGFPGLVLLGVAYAIWEEALVDRYWFFPTFWQDSGVGGYSVVGHTNVLLAVHLTAFHTAISIGCSVVLVERWAPAWRHRPWTNRPGLIAAGVVLIATLPLYGEFDRHPPVPVLVAAAALLVLAVVGAFVVGRRRPPGPVRTGTPPRRGLGVVAFLAILAHWIATYGIAETSTPWPLGVLLAVVPIVVGVVAVRALTVTDPLGPDGLRVVVGLVAFFAALDLFVGLGGRYDLALGGLLTVIGVHRLGRRARRDQEPAPAGVPATGFSGTRPRDA